VGRVVPVAFSMRFTASSANCRRVMEELKLELVRSVSRPRDSALRILPTAQLLAEDTSTGRAPMASEPTTEPPLTRKVRVTVLEKFPLVTVAVMVWEPEDRLDTSRE